jgi:hypothetical protein
MVVHDRDREKTKELAALGASVAPNPETLAEELMWCCRAFRATLR